MSERDVLALPTSSRIACTPATETCSSELSVVSAALVDRPISLQYLLLRHSSLANVMKLTCLDSEVLVEDWRWPDPNEHTAP